MWRMTWQALPAGVSVDHSAAIQFTQFTDAEGRGLHSSTFRLNVGTCLWNTLGGVETLGHGSY